MNLIEKPSHHTVPFAQVALGVKGPLQLFERPVCLDAVSQH